MSEEGDAALDLEDAVSLLADPATDTPEADEEELGTTEAEEIEAEAEEADSGQPEAEAEEDQEAEAPEEDHVEVFQDGEWVSVPRDEAKSAALRHADYTQKTMEIAETRKAMEREQATIAENQQKLQDQLAQWAVSAQQEPNWAHLAQTMDPREFQVARVEWEQSQQRQAEAADAYRQLAQQQEAAKVKAREASIIEAFPEWADMEKGVAGMRGLAATAAEYGFSQEELAGMVDGRLARALSDLQELKALKASNAATAKRVAETPKTLSPGAKTTKTQAAAKRHTEARKRFQKSGSIEDALRLDF